MFKEALPGEDPYNDQNKPIYDYFSDENWYTYVKKAGKLVWSAAYFDETSTKQYIISVLAPIMKNGKFVRITGVDINSNDLTRLLLKNKISETGYAILPRKAKKQNFRSSEMQ